MKIIDVDFTSCMFIFSSRHASIIGALSQKGITYNIIFFFELVHQRNLACYRIVTRCFRGQITQILGHLFVAKQNQIVPKIIDEIETPIQIYLEKLSLPFML